MNPSGTTRSSVHSNHALITPDTHVISPLLRWQQASAVVHISPALGAAFTQYSVLLESGGASALPPAGVERFFFVETGTVALTIAADAPRELTPGGYAWIPPDVAHQVTSAAPARLVVFEKPYEAGPGGSVSPAVVGQEQEVSSEPFMGDPDAQLKTLLPLADSFDMAVNLFTFQPGANLPQVEVHVMEHGLLMLAGAGVYRLGERWYPVEAGDVIWMAPYCPQWFVAMGKTPARYLYYKDIHRVPREHLS